MGLGGSWYKRKGKGEGVLPRWLNGAAALPTGWTEEDEEEASSCLTPVRVKKTTRTPAPSSKGGNEWLEVDGPLGPEVEIKYDLIDKYMHSRIPNEDILFLEDAIVPTRKLLMNYTRGFPHVALLSRAEASNFFFSSKKLLTLLVSSPFILPQPRQSI
ncbi:hypothetical protein Taro_052578 [Colocasia esculenta]|uniref:Uncharacterized protein n=1 Tax=Colocasia esculenta TaxID=4460 RepID=A0A843XK62_COLES|nr:hypothetical protein [Colocasia esculenta]